MAEAGGEGQGAPGPQQAAPATSANTRGRSWCFTVYDAAALAAASTFNETVPACKAMVWQVEECPTTHRRHIQASDHLGTTFRRKAANRRFAERVRSTLKMPAFSMGSASCFLPVLTLSACAVNGASL